jgi:hypothetical protein
MADLRLPLSHRPALHSASVFLLWAGGAHYDENKERGANMKYCQLAHSSCRSSRRQARGLTLRRGSATKLTSMARTVTTPTNSGLAIRLTAGTRSAIARRPKRSAAKLTRTSFRAPASASVGTDRFGYARRGGGCCEARPSEAVPPWLALPPRRG